MNKPNTKEEIYTSIKQKLDEIKKEKNDKKTRKSKYDNILISCCILIFSWVIVPFSISGNQIIEVCLILIAVWFLYHFIFFSIQKSINIFKDTKKYLDTYIKMSKKERNAIHDALDRATPSLSKTGIPTSIMFFFVLLLFITLILSPFLTDEITINIANSRPIMTFIIFIFIGMRVIVLINISRSMKGMHEYEKMTEEKIFSDEKIMEIIDRYKLKKLVPWCCVIWGNFPIVLSIFFVVFIIYENITMFSLSLNILGGLIVLQLIMMYFLRKRYRIVSTLNLINQIETNLKNLRNRMKKGKIRKIQKISEEYDNIVYKELSLLKKKSQQ